MNILSPKQWGAAVDYDEWKDRRIKKDAIAIHYNGPAVANYDAGPAREREVLRDIERFHRNTRGWRGIAYGWGIGFSGDAYRLRGWNRYGAHLGDWDNDGVQNNDEVIPVFWIIGQGQEPSPAMWRTFGELKAMLEADGRANDALPVFGHREIQPTKPTACPGDIIMNGIKKQLWVPIVSPSGWQKPGDPVTTSEDAEKAWKYMTGRDLELPLAIGWIADALMRQDQRISRLEP